MVAMMSLDYHPQGAIANPFIDVSLFLVAAICIALFLVRMGRNRVHPQLFFSVDFAFAVTPLFCATASLVIDLFRLLDVTSRNLQISDALLEHRIGYALRPVYAAVIASSLALLILCMQAAISRNQQKLQSGEKPLHGAVEDQTRPA